MELVLRAAAQAALSPKQGRPLCLALEAFRLLPVATRPERKRQLDLLVPRPTTWGIPETIVCKILMFMLSFWAQGIDRSLYNSLKQLRHILRVPGHCLFWQGAPVTVVIDGGEAKEERQLCAGHWPALSNFGIDHAGGAYGML